MGLGAAVCPVVRVLAAAGCCKLHQQHGSGRAPPGSCLPPGLTAHPAPARPAAPAGARTWRTCRTCRGGTSDWRLTLRRWSRLALRCACCAYCACNRLRPRPAAVTAPLPGAPCTLPLVELHMCAAGPSDWRPELHSAPPPLPPLPPLRQQLEAKQAALTGSLCRRRARSAPSLSLSCRRSLWRQ